MRELIKALQKIESTIETLKKYDNVMHVTIDPEEENPKVLIHVSRKLMNVLSKEYDVKISGRDSEKYPYQVSIEIGNVVLFIICGEDEIAKYKIRETV